MCLLDPALTLATARHDVPPWCLPEGVVRQADHDGTDDLVVGIDGELGAVNVWCIAVKADGERKAAGVVECSMVHDWLVGVACSG